MKNNKGIYLLFLLFITGFLFTGCNSNPLKIALQTMDKNKGIEAVNKVSDQPSLAEIATDAKNEYIRNAALEKLTDQNLLTKIVLVAYDSINYDKAVKMITNKDLLKKIAITETEDNNLKFISVKQAAMYQINDLRVLINIIFECKDWRARENAINRLCDASLFAELAKEKNDIKNQLIYKFIQAFQDVNKQALRGFEIMDDVFPALIVLNDSLVIQKFGEIDWIKTKWEKISQGYGLKNNLVTKGGEGEEFTLSIKLKKVEKALTGTWKSSFPESIKSNDPTTFGVAIKLEKFLSPVLNQLPNIKLKNIISDSMTAVKDNTRLWISKIN